MEDAPLCKCHGLPKHKNGFEYGKQKWRCRVAEKERQRLLYQENPEYAERKRQMQAERYKINGKEQAKRYYNERKARGVCTRCLAPLLSDVYCWDCLNKKEMRRALSI